MRRPCPPRGAHPELGLVPSVGFGKRVQIPAKMSHVDIPSSRAAPHLADRRPLIPDKAVRNPRTTSCLHWTNSFTSNREGERDTDKMDHVRMDAPFQMPGMAPPPLMNPPPQIFGGYTPDGLPLQHLPPELAAQMFSDHGLMDDTSEAKRRRIARVSLSLLRCALGPMAPQRQLTWVLDRPVTCAGRRRLSVTASYHVVRIVSIIRQIASSHRLRRRGIRPKGMLQTVLSRCHKVQHG
jgi:hypothetical protein